MLVLDLDYSPQCVAHAHQVRDLHSMVGRGARTRTFRVSYTHTHTHTHISRDPIILRPAGNMLPHFSPHLVAQFGISLHTLSLSLDVVGRRDRRGSSPPPPSCALLTGLLPKKGYAFSGV